MLIFSISLFLFLTPFLGGQFGLRFKDKLHLISGFSAGSVVGLAFFELIPESAHILEEVSLGGEFLHPTLVLIGIVFYMLLDRVFKIHKHSHEEEYNHSHLDNHEHSHSGKFKAATFSFHGFIDGLAVGLAFQTSVFLGIITAIAVITHSFSDGLNTAIACQKGGMKESETKKWILADAISPVFGMLLGILLKVPDGTIGVVIAVMSGFFVYVSMTDLVPESFHNHPTRWTTISTILGIVFIAVVATLTHTILLN